MSARIYTIEEIFCLGRALFFARPFLRVDTVVFSLP